ncbi:hypothetical protein DB88DRAFT_198211 [Papiliotrema laurentii]|uniref:CCHC-type domain-containing protein n=1 Tax=Papiliotrema laurentii TaxID=5418 RepID=A0AAD9L703_PAPLA|nr:hypothetical protein DB88DRAFT_198211 [Papiliotrema laurentii]
MFGAAANVPGSRQGCFKCGNLGHIAENCQAPGRLCYNCRWNLATSRPTAPSLDPPTASNATLAEVSATSSLTAPPSEASSVLAASPAALSAVSARNATNAVESVTLPDSVPRPDSEADSEVVSLLDPVNPLSTLTAPLSSATDATVRTTWLETACCPVTRLPSSPARSATSARRPDTSLVTAPRSARSSRPPSRPVDEIVPSLRTCLSC